MNYQEEIEKLLQDVEIKSYYEENSYIKKLPNLYVVYMLLKKYQTYLQQQQQEQEQEQRKEAFIQRLKEREKEREEKRKEQEQRELQAMQETQPPEPPPYDPHSDESKEQLLFIHNARQWQLLKERNKNAVFIDKMLIIISHEFLIYEREIIEMKINKLLEYLNIDITKDNIDYIRKTLKTIKNFLIEKEFIQDLTTKKSVLICTLNTLFISELREKRIITRIEKTLFSLSDNAYKITRVSKFFENNFDIKDSNIKINSLFPYVIDTNESRKREKIKRILDI